MGFLCTHCNHYIKTSKKEWEQIEDEARAHAKTHGYKITVGGRITGKHFVVGGFLRP